MAKNKRDKDMIYFSGRRHTRRGIASAIMGLIAVVSFNIVSIVSASYKGNAGMIVGIIGFLILILALLGFIRSVKAFKERDIFYRFPIIGAVLNGLMIIILFILYILALL